MASTYAAGGNGSIQLKGASELARGLKKAGADMKDLRQVNKEAAQIVVPEAKNLAPKGKTGKLAASVRAGATQKAGVVRAGSKRVPYAGVIDYGWATTSTPRISPTKRQRTRNRNGRNSTRTPCRRS